MAAGAGIISGPNAACSKGGVSRSPVCQEDYYSITTAKDRDRFMRLNAEIRSDLYWRSEFMIGWNGVGMIASPDQEVVVLESDASGSWGCGAVWGTY